MVGTPIGGTGKDSVVGTPIGGRGKELVSGRDSYWRQREG